MIKITTKELLENFNITGEKCIYKNNKPCVIDFNATWCKPCKTIHRTLSEMEEKLYEVSRGSVKEEMTYSQIQEMLLSPGFMEIFKKLKVGEEMFNQDKMLNFKRLK